MPTFVEITPDAFGAVFDGTRIGKKVDEEYRWAHSQSQVRRPVRGIQLKEETFAEIQVLRADGTPLALFDAGGSILRDGVVTHGQGFVNSNFLIQSVQESRQEKQQVVLTFGEPYVFFFGEQPRILQVSGVLLNTQDFNWRAEWWENYDKFLRGTACVRSRSRVYLSWDDIIVEGYMMMAAASESATDPNVVQFQFQLFVTNYQNIQGLGDRPVLAAQNIDIPAANTEFLNSLGVGGSSTLAVRTKNLEAQLASGRGKNSLLGSLRDQSAFDTLSAGTSALIEIEGQVLNLLTEAGNFVSGRNIRVPIGFAGSTVFDDAQIALASISGLESVTLGENNTVSISRSLAGRSFVIRGALGPKSSPARGTGYVWENEDEYISQSSSAHPSLIQDLYRDQVEADTDKALAKALRAFDKFGVDVTPPDEMLILFKRAAFGILSVTAGGKLVDEDVRSVLNFI